MSERFFNKHPQAAEQWQALYLASKHEGDDEEQASRRAWAAVHRLGYAKDEKGQWHCVGKVEEIQDAAQACVDLVSALSFLPSCSKDISSMRTHAKLWLVAQWLCTHVCEVDVEVMLMEMQDELDHHDDESGAMS
jgi:hypothetical protein